MRMFFLTLLMLPALCMGQHYEISGQSSLSGVFTLTVYDGDSTTHTYTDKANKGMFFFSGNVAKPVLASIEHPTMNQPLYFYLEGSEISINVNASRPDASIIKGSRTNSEYRYLMERYYSTADPNAFLRQQMKENAGSIFLPFVLYRQMSNIDDGTLRQLIGQVVEPGTHTYHYTLLRRWLRETPAVSEGSEMPDFACEEKRKRYENDNWTPFLKEGEDPAGKPPRTVSPWKPTEAAHVKAREGWESRHYWGLGFDQSVIDEFYTGKN